jgi:predicted anti-sigma-YlaC factor YlaD
VDCKQCQVLLSDFLDKELPTGEMDKITDHLHHCDPCNQQLTELASLHSHYSEFISLPGEGDELSQRILQELPERRKGRKIPCFSWRMVIVISGIVVIAVVFLVSWPLWYPFLRILLRMMGQLIYVPLLMIVDHSLLSWEMILGIFGVALLLYVGFRRGNREEEKTK